MRRRARRQRGDLVLPPRELGAADGRIAGLLDRFLELAAQREQRGQKRLTFRGRLPKRIVSARSGRRRFLLAIFVEIHWIGVVWKGRRRRRHGVPCVEPKIVASAVGLGRCRRCRQARINRLESRAYAFGRGFLTRLQAGRTSGGRTAACPAARVAKLVDAPGLGPDARKGVGVRVPSLAPLLKAKNPVKSLD